MEIRELIVIKLFLNDEYDLKGLSAYPELEGLKYSNLDPRLQRHILKTKKTTD